MIVLTQSYQELGRSEAYAFSDKGQVCACLYARMVDAATVAIKLTRIISGTSSYVGYSYASAQATLSGSLSHSWNGGASGTVYVGEHTVFEQNFAVAAGRWSGLPMGTMPPEVHRAIFACFRSLMGAAGVTFS